MSRKRKQHSPALKAKVALAAWKGDRTTAQLAGQFSVHPTQVSQWKRELLEGAEELFGRDRRREGEERKELIDELYREIGRLQMESAWLKKKADRLG